jgi:fucose 4-O-acetylase-like acetyltransferase
MMKQQQGGQRLEWVDTAKGIGIILVAVAHAWTRGPVRDLIYAFHMPLFFLLSGYMSKPRPMADFTRKQLWAMAVPYAAFLLLLAGWDWAFETLRGHHPIFRDGQDALWRLGVGGSELRGPFTIFWFVPSLFFARLLQNALGNRWPQARDPRWLAVMIPALVGGVWIGARSDFSPLGLLSVPAVLVLLWIGALWRTVGDDRKLVLGALVVSLVLVATVKLPPLNMKVGDYGTPWLSLPGAVLLSLGLVWIARRLPLPVLGYLGRMSLVIMYLHVAVVHYLSPYLPKYALLALALLIPLGFGAVVQRIALIRRLFLGQA